MPKSILICCPRRILRSSSSKTLLTNFARVTRIDTRASRPFSSPQGLKCPWDVLQRARHIGGLGRRLRGRFRRDLPFSICRKITLIFAAGGKKRTCVQSISAFEDGGKAVLRKKHFIFYRQLPLKCSSWFNSSTDTVKFYTFSMR